MKKVTTFECGFDHNFDPCILLHDAEGNQNLFTVGNLGMSDFKLANVLERKLRASRLKGWSIQLSTSEKVLRALLALVENRFEVL